MDLELRGRNAVVTGCSVGIGREIARVLAAEGASTLVIARRGELLKTLQDEIEGAGWKRPTARRPPESVTKPSRASVTWTSS